jgi:hypothetical protein
MKQRVISEAGALASTLDLGSAVQTKPVWYSLSGAVGSIVLLVILSLLASNQFRHIAMSRLFTPFNGLAWPKNVQIDLLGQQATRVPVGQRVDVKMRLAKGDRDSMKAIVYYQYGHADAQGSFVPDSAVEQEYMARGADAGYAASLDARVDQNQPAGLMRVWIKSGDDEARLQDITVVPRLAIKAVTATVTPPKYVSNGEANAVTFDLAKGPAVMPIGAQVKLDVRFNKHLAAGKDVTIEPADAEMKPPQLSGATVDDTGVSLAWQARESLRFHIKGTDVDGFTNTALEEYEVIVRPDQNPSVQIESPRRNEERTPVSVVPLQGLAEDDYGVQTLKLVVDRVGGSSSPTTAPAGGAEKKHWEVPLVVDANPSANVGWQRAEGGDRLRFKLNYNWDLSALADAKLKAGDVLEYFLVVTDNFNLDGQTHPPVASGHLRITLISQEDLTGRVVDELRNLKQRINEAKNAQERTRQETGVLADDTKNKPDLDQGDRAAAERLINQQASVANQSKQIAAKLDQIQARLDENKSPAQELKDLSRDVKNDLNNTAEQPMKQAAQDITAANQSKKGDQQQRNQILNKAQDEQKQAAGDLQRAMDRMENIGTLQQTIDKIAALLKEQQDISKQTQEVGKENLGKKPEEMKPEDRKKLEDAANAQAKLSEKTQAAVANMNKTSEQMKQSDPTSSQAMKQAAQTAQQQQVPQNQQKAAQSAKQNQQAQAQSQQKQVELGLMMMLNQLKDAERRKLAELSKQLTELQAQIANLIRRQSGHNLDNLVLTDRLAKIDAQVRTALFSKSERDEKNPPKSDLNVMSPGQELTERNTRDISKSAENLPNGADVATQLVKAAGKMERAAVYLRDKKLPDAYEPPQVDALAALEEAKKVVDQMKDKVDEQIAQTEKEAVRQQYVKIKTDQEGLNGDTTKVESSRKDGALGRADELKLGQLSGAQAKLADRIVKMNEDLEKLGSLVYVWANNDIAKSMNEVKADLAKLSSGVPTQSEQKRILEQLQAMIDNLKETPRQSKFAQDGGGGGGNGQPKAKLPTEAELRLMKALQEAVNRDTKTQGELKDNKDKPKLLALGNRQGELRDLLGQLLEKSSNGEVKFGPEPDNRDQLPEEANAEDVEKQELEKALLQDKPDDEATEKQVNRVGDRMARSRQRLALNNDPGQTTQTIQKKIVEDMDFLIEQARRQLAQARNQQQQQGQQPQQAKNQAPKPGQAQNQGQQQAQMNQATSPAQASKGGPGNENAANLSKDIRESAAEWGTLTPRARAAVVEGGNENIIEPYAKLIQDYYKTLSAKQTERNP